MAYEHEQSEPLDAERLAAELLRALRGKRSRPAFSRHLGYQSNVAQRWETRQSWPTAARFLQACERMQFDVPAALERFLRYRPSWLTKGVNPERTVSQLLTELRGKNRVVDVARQTGLGRTSVSRLFAGKAAPKLPEFLQLVEVCSRRVLDLVVQFVPVEKLPSVRARWRSLELSRELAYSQPLSHAVLRALELDAYRSSAHRNPAFIARRLGVELQVVEESLALLKQSGQVQRRRGGWVPQQTVVDTGADRTRARALKLTWTKEALARLERGSPGQFGYSLFSIAAKDLRRLAEIQNAFIREMQAVIAESEPGECVALFCTQLLDLAVADENAFTSRTLPT